MICGFLWERIRSCFYFDIPPIMHATFIWSIGLLDSFILERAKAMLLSICCANYLVGVKIRPIIHCGSLGKDKFYLSLWSYERIGAAKANVFPEPVCAATKKS